MARGGTKRIRRDPDAARLVAAACSPEAQATAARRFLGAECPGYCCAVIRTPAGVDLRRGLERRWADAAQVAAMLVEITPGEAAEVNRVLCGWEKWKPDQASRYFTCRNWDAPSGLCTIYDDRPAMCRAYPASTGVGCTHGCRCKA